MDFALGCAVSDDAKFVTTLSSTTSDLKYSRIVYHPTKEENPFAPQLPLVPRYLADYVVTEFGVAHLKGKTNNERSRSLINIAHPNFRATLTEQAREAGLLYGK
jgi:4-hydroxybutyrate CoA-transferase